MKKPGQEFGRSYWRLPSPERFVLKPLTQNAQVCRCSMIRERNKAAMARPDEVEYYLCKNLENINLYPDSHTDYIDRKSCDVLGLTDSVGWM